MSNRFNTSFDNPSLRNPNVRKVTLYGYRKPLKDEDGVLQCHCTQPWPLTWGDGTYRCDRCDANWYR